MATALHDQIEHYASNHLKPAELHFQYGTAGFRTLGSTLNSVLFRMGLLAGLRSRSLNGQTIGVMVTASHNPEADNGVKLVDPHGEMLEAAWEGYATSVANADSTKNLIIVLQSLVTQLNINMQITARVVYARDTRSSGPDLIQALEDGMSALGVEARNGGITTTPILHYLVRCINCKGTVDDYGVDSEDGYYDKLSGAFKRLMRDSTSAPHLIVDCANGVGALALEKFAPHVAGVISFEPVNTDLKTPGALNKNAGADFVKTQQRFPPVLDGKLTAGQRAASFDGDADRLMYYFADDNLAFKMLDGDKIAVLVADFLVNLVKEAGLDDEVQVGVVQTAYANGSSTKSLETRLPVTCVPTGVKHLHHAAQSYGIGVYFEANGHGTVLFSPETLKSFRTYEPKFYAQQRALESLIDLTKLINSTVGDALSDLLLVEVVLAQKNYTAKDWDSSYTDLPNRLVKVLVKDRSQYRTEDAERKLLAPEGLQAKIDAQVAKFSKGRSFVRASGTEDAVRVYAEASTRAEADTLAFTVAGIVYDDAGGAPEKRPAEFLRP